MRQWLSAILALLLAVVLVNDVSRLAAAHFEMRDIAQVAVDAASNAARQAPDSPEVGFAAAAATMASDEATITGYTQEERRVHVWVEGPVRGTIILSPIVSLWTGGSWNDPMLVTKDNETTY